jgi:hypothetical protein
LVFPLGGGGYWGEGELVPTSIDNETTTKHRTILTLSCSHQTCSPTGGQFKKRESERSFLSFKQEYGVLDSSMVNPTEFYEVL